jgi:hypothetical protein
MTWSTRRFVIADAVIITHSAAIMLWPHLAMRLCFHAAAFNLFLQLGTLWLEDRAE